MKGIKKFHNVNEEQNDISCYLAAGDAGQGKGVHRNVIFVKFHISLYNMHVTIHTDVHSSTYLRIGVENIHERHALSLVPSHS